MVSARRRQVKDAPFASRPAFCLPSASSCVLNSDGVRFQPDRSQCHPGGADARIPAGLPLCPALAAAGRGLDAGHHRVARDRHRRQYRGLQRRQLPAPQAASLPGSRSPRHPLVAFAGHQHSAGLALAGAVHRHPAREPLVRGDVNLAGPRRYPAGRRSARARRGAAHVVQPVPSAGRQTAARSPLVA